MPARTLPEIDKELFDSYIQLVQTLEDRSDRANGRAGAWQEAMRRTPPQDRQPNHKADGEQILDALRRANDDIGTNLTLGLVWDYQGRLNAQQKAQFERYLQKHKNGEYSGRADTYKRALVGFFPPNNQANRTGTNGTNGVNDTRNNGVNDRRTNGNSNGR